MTTNLGAVVMVDDAASSAIALDFVARNVQHVYVVATDDVPEVRGAREVHRPGGDQISMGAAFRIAAERGIGWVAVRRDLGDPVNLLSDLVQAAGDNMSPSTPGFGAILTPEAPRELRRLLFVLDEADGRFSGLLVHAGVEAAVRLGAQLDVLVLSAPGGRATDPRGFVREMLPIGRQKGFFDNAMRRAVAEGLEVNWLLRDLGTSDSIVDVVLDTIEAGEYDAVIDDLGGMSLGPRIGRDGRAERFVQGARRAKIPLAVIERTDCVLILVIDAVQMGVISESAKRAGIAATLAFGIFGGAVTPAAHAAAAPAPTKQSAQATPGVLANSYEYSNQINDVISAEKSGSATSTTKTPSTATAGASAATSTSASSAAKASSTTTASSTSGTTSSASTAKAEQARPAAPAEPAAATKPTLEAQEGGATPEQIAEAQAEVAEAEEAVAKEKQDVAEAQAAAKKSQAALDAEAEQLSKAQAQTAAAVKVLEEAEAEFDAARVATVAASSEAQAHPTEEAKMTVAEAGMDLDQAQVSADAALGDYQSAKAAETAAKAEYDKAKDSDVQADAALSAQKSEYAAAQNAQKQAEINADYLVANAAPEVAFPIASDHVVDTHFHQEGSLWSSGHHTGIDFVVPPGTPIQSTTDGTVIYSGDGSSGGWGASYGNHVIIEDENGYRHLYAHMETPSDLQAGQTVQAGETIGTVGNTGNSTAPHLHYEVRQGAYAYDVDSIDPMQFLPEEVAAQGTVDHDH